MAGAILRHYIDLIEAVTAPWGVSYSDLFQASLITMLPKVPDLPDRLKRFISIKLPNPMDRNALVGKHDRPFTGPLVGFWHCHLAPDAILIYRLQNRSVQLVAICQHADIEGKRAKTMAKRLATV
jgi:mRNA-degrading endonuclease YafQ of YafQ-DinJ toxin-antitoxin module